MNGTDFEKHYRFLENMYHAAPCNKYYSPTLKIGNGQTKLSIKVKKDFFHAGNAVHGAVCFKMIDDASYFAANSLERKTFLLTSNINIYFTRPVTSGIMRAIGKVVHRGRSQFIAEAVVFDSEDREIARGTGLFVKSNKELNDQLGYK